MAKTIQHFLFGFGSIIDIFSLVERLPLSKGGFVGDQKRLHGDFDNIAKDFTKAVNGKQQNQAKR